VDIHHPNALDPVYDPTHVRISPADRTLPAVADHAADYGGLRYGDPEWSRPAEEPGR
jgi:hypothetical protein